MNFKDSSGGKIEEISSRDHLPFIVGGTGLYIQAVLYDYQFQETAKDLSVRKQLEEKAKTEGIHSLFQQLQEIDPEYAEKIHPNNERRVIRALEVYLTTGKPISYHCKRTTAGNGVQRNYHWLNNGTGKIVSTNKRPGGSNVC